MSEGPWLTIIGLGEDGPEGLSDASRTALAAAKVVMGPPRHLSLLPEIVAQRVEWPVPFADGIAQLLEFRGQATVVLASGDPFWFGAGSVLARHLEPGEWVAHPGRATFSLAAAAMAWPLEKTTCMGLHAAPLSRLRPVLAEGQRAILLLRDGDAAAQLAEYLSNEGFGASQMHVLEALGGPRERQRQTTASTFAFDDISHPVCVALECAGGLALPTVPGRSTVWFDHDGQISKPPMRAMTLAALAPSAGAHLWDIGGGSGAVAIEWLLSHPTTTATSFEADPTRAARIEGNAVRLGVDRLRVLTGRAPAVLQDETPPDAVFIGGGLSEVLLDHLWQMLPAGTRVVANAVTLESEALLATWQARNGGDLLRVELSRAQPLGSRRGWSAANPIVQWSVQR
ncbi:precorrin-6Y methyltransferase [Actibacterium mucosum KCTC 23349]|uniref:Precorrin-6Y methyltransferase n=1 Tax=Actibacterium mucosum KCTC 23349 TaxID=1454373 RepID=A0A037ZFB7_9RHOB|nr:bifunctional cobalt-precorrin-7 (C(5))-methyltransferase/cobalt-precorrin-6B (C(15))-methyltransferase [Actibacterium mucosum]KAJ55175.1 precorrin-6Y methyltransferase [Actibacterium mucosum KCTC 23349]